MTDLIIQVVGILGCAGVLVGCVCRIDKMGWRRTKVAWWLVYVAFGAYALGVGLDLALGHYVDWYEVGGIGGLVLEMVLTMRAWRNGPPRAVMTEPGGLL